MDEKQLALLEAMEKEILDAFEKMKEHIYPCLKPMETETRFEVEKDGKRIEITLPHLPFLGNTCIFFALDEGESFQLIQKRMIPYGMTEENLLQLAVRNLVRDYPFELFEADYGGYALRADPDHTSSYILLAPLWQKLAAEDLKDDLIISIPARDIILFVKASDQEKIAKLKETAKKVYDNNFKELTLSLLYYDKEKKTMSEIKEEAS